MAALFGLDAGARGLTISRRRWLDDKPRLLESIWLPLRAANHCSACPRPNGATCSIRCSARNAASPSIAPWTK
ncbi:hypothetical protein ACTMU2_10365 [Cupriavidus basilensis]